MTSNPLGYDFMSFTQSDAIRYRTIDCSNCGHYDNYYFKCSNFREIECANCDEFLDGFSVYYGVIVK